MKKKTLGLIASLIFALATVGGYYWLWTVSLNAEVTPSSVATTSTYAVVEIESVKKEAVDILNGLENRGNIPIPVPTEKMGRPNPYLNY